MAMIIPKDGENSEKIKNHTKASLHSPDEVLASAEALLATNEPQFMRAAIIEAISALETYVEVTVFQLLKQKLDPVFVKWLAKKTNSSFKDRLVYVTPLALDTKVDLSNQLWQRYLRAKEIRNQIAHVGRTASREEAAEVIDTVKAWLAYLGSTAEVDISILNLKKYLAQNTAGKILNEESIIKLITEYYASTESKVKLHKQIKFINGSMSFAADLMLDFGSEKVMFEIKFSKENLDENLRRLERVYRTSRANNFRLILLVITDRGIPKSFQDITRINDKTSVMFIKI